MVTDNYLIMKEILKVWFLIIPSQIIYDHMEIIQYQHLFFLSIYLSIYLFDTQHQSSFSVFSKNLSPDNTSTGEPLTRGVFLTLHYHMHFINNRNEEIQAKNIRI